MSISNRAKSIAALSLVIAIALATQADAHASGVMKFIVGPGEVQSQPGANQSWIGWRANRPGTHTYDTWAEQLPRAGHTPVRLNPPGIHGYGIGISQDSNEALYEQYTRASGWDLAWVPDLATPASQPSLPAGINRVSSAEIFPSISNNFMLFTRVTNKYTFVTLYDRSAKTFRVLAKKLVIHKPYYCVCTFSGQVTDRYATWTQCGKGFLHCNAFYYDSVTKHSHAIPNPDRLSFYGPAISEMTGLMYAVKSGNGCGLHPGVVRWEFGTTKAPVRIANFPHRIDTYGGLVVVNDGTNDTIYLPIGSCTRFSSHIYWITTANT
jgi:hypothetical protein